MKRNINNNNNFKIFLPFVVEEESTWQPSNKI